MADYSLGLVANSQHRAGPTSLLPRLVNEFEPLFREVLQPRLNILGGTYAALTRLGLLRNYPVVSLAAGNDGGLVQLANKAVPELSSKVSDVSSKGARHACLGCGDDLPRPELTALIYLIDPRDHTSLTPGNLALKRQCVVNDVIFLDTFTGAREWLILLWRNLVTDVNRLEPYFLGTAMVASLRAKALCEKKSLPIRSTEVIDYPEPASLGAKYQPPPMLDGTIALIAHDEHKKCIEQFARLKAPLLHSFRRRLGTQSTAERINTHEAGLVTAFRGGPDGGDVQIAEEVRKGNCQKILFFEDPFYSREHEVDIQVLERMARTTEHDVLCLHTHAAANQWATMWEKCGAPQLEPSLVTLHSAYEYLLPGVKLILADESGWTEGGPATEWQRISAMAAPVLLGLIVEYARMRRARNELTYVGVSWRRSVRDVLNALKSFLRDLEKRDPALAHRYTDVSNMFSVPLIGVRAEYDLDAEANKNAEDLARSLSPEGEVAQFGSLTLPAFLHASQSVDIPSQTRTWWNRLDVGIFNCQSIARELHDPSTPHADDRARQYRRVLEEAEKAGAKHVVAGLFVDADGRHVDADRYRRIGVSHQDLRKLKLGGGAMLVAGGDSVDPSSALAAIKGGLVSVFVTSRRFAMTVLRKHAD